MRPTYVNCLEGILPWKFIRHVREGGYELDRNIDFNHFSNKATVFQNESKDYKVKPNTQDLLSAFYYARTLDLQNAKEGQEFIHFSKIQVDRYWVFAGSGIKKLVIMDKRKIVP